MPARITHFLRHVEDLQHHRGQVGQRRPSASQAQHRTLQSGRGLVKIDMLAIASIQ
jgi:hypothetical protein